MYWPPTPILYHCILRKAHPIPTERHILWHLVCRTAGHHVDFRWEVASLYPSLCTCALTTPFDSCQSESAGNLDSASARATSCVFRLCHTNDNTKSTYLANSRTCATTGNTCLPPLMLAIADTVPLLSHTTCTAPLPSPGMAPRRTPSFSALRYPWLLRLCSTIFPMRFCTVRPGRTES